VSAPTRKHYYGPRNCVVCGKEFVPCRRGARKGQMICSKSCANNRPRSARIKEEPVARFFRHTTISDDGHWLWTSPLSNDGYGTFWLNNKDERAHRASWILFRGDLPKDVQVCHKCDIPACVHPGHLFLGTQQDNLDDMVAKGRSERGERHHNARLNDISVLFIRGLAKCGWRETALGALFGVAHTTINSIKSRKIWRHV
jgi:hypothetical protein